MRDEEKSKNYFQIILSIFCGIFMLQSCGPQKNVSQSLKSTLNNEKQEAPITTKAVVVDSIVIVTISNRARLCPHVNCGQGEEILRIPTNTKLQVQAETLVEGSTHGVVWYKVNYKGKEGWVSIYDTDKVL